MAQTPQLNRSLSLGLLTLYGLGTTIGAGIFVLIGKVAGAGGSLAPVSFLLAAVIAGLSALSFAEMSSRFPESAGEAVYVKEGLDSGISGDLLAMDLRDALHHLGSITGEVDVEELLGNIFGRFCIGK